MREGSPELGLEVGVAMICCNDTYNMFLIYLLCNALMISVDVRFSYSTYDVESNLLNSGNKCEIRPTEVLLTGEIAVA